jgi:hypothetical protein
VAVAVVMAILHQTAVAVAQVDISFQAARQQAVAARLKRPFQ